MPTTRQSDIRENQPPEILVVGASARFLVQSAMRCCIGSGRKCLAIDLYGDRDLQFACRQVKVGRLDRDEVKAAIDVLVSHDDVQARQNLKVVLAGGMENRHALLDWLSAAYSVSGASAGGIRGTNSPTALREFCQSFEISCPEILLNVNTSIDCDRWLLKPKFSAGGYRIRRADKVAKVPSSEMERYYFQEFTPGDSFGSTYYASGGTCELLGTARQIIGDTAFGAEAGSFSYCGSVGPVEFGFQHNEMLCKIGASAASHFELKGVFGIDWILDRKNEISLIEINPRIPASAELYERTGKIGSVVQLHLSGNESNCFIEPASPKPTGQVHVKAIVYSKQKKTLLVDDAFSNEMWEQSLAEDSVADIPSPGALIHQGAPICSLFANGGNRDQAYQRVWRLACDVQERIKTLEPLLDSSVP